MMTIEYVVVYYKWVAVGYKLDFRLTIKYFPVTSFKRLIFISSSKLHDRNLKLKFFILIKEN